MSQNFDLKIISTNPVGQIYDREKNVLRPFAAAYFPKEILDVAGWEENSILMLTVDKGVVTIKENTSGDELLYTNDLTYEIDEENE